MKTSYPSLLSLVMLLAAAWLFPGQASAQKATDKAPKTVTVSFKVFGNCGECKARIESVAMDSKGVKKAVWDAQTDTLVLVGSAKMDPAKVAQAIAKAGHKSDLAPADAKAYAALPECCQYEHTHKH